jgi:protein ImuA
MTAPLLTRKTYDTRPGLPVLDGMTLTLARLHEICGPARHVLAMIVAAATRGPVFWITPAWQGDHLNPDGMRPFVQPGRFTFVHPNQPIDLLWTLEEVLRSGAAPLAVAELPEPPGLTPVRRLHLAAENGAKTGACAPIGLILTPGEGGAPGVETRWHMAQDHSSSRRAWALSRRRARSDPPATWALTGRPGQWHVT